VIAAAACGEALETPQAARKSVADTRRVARATRPGDHATAARDSPKTRTPERSAAPIIA
jgi:hypothetical protein